MTAGSNSSLKLQGPAGREDEARGRLMANVLSRQLPHRPNRERGGLLLICVVVVANVGMAVVAGCACGPGHVRGDPDHR